uniref:Uncharacterized protein n=1 Tax=Chromera velia CCMP2878 TaxID=1169474 RepID=A0A0G4IBH7_9ALVE|eukprot:Cvel_2191.t1-p1 / transcript=Cvel_2191.t1 / gene=Cvel_2191 / organism=Chromera_velia_CCMP2878 / gene_product=hypothetical protein / transcript_product=hypothetical protein / location=Cvel_scaffold85:3546-5030(+) / protein_length=337 / sequence_SO=supercontig / SO=protein_coding / is_pseudo=false
MPSTVIGRLLKSHTASGLAEMQAQDGEVDTKDKEECQGAYTEAEEVIMVSTTVTSGMDRMGMLHRSGNKCQHATIADRHHTSSRTIQNCGTRETNGVEGHSKGSPYHPTSCVTGYDLVLGQDFLKLKDPVMQYHYREDRLVVADLPVFHCWYDDGRKPMRVAPLHHTKVTKRSRALLRVDVDGVGEEETVILRRNFPRVHPGLAVPDQIVIVRAGVATIEVLNVSQQDLRLGTESLLTFAEPASRVASVIAVTANVTTSTPPQNPPPSPSLPKVDLLHIPPEVRGKYESLLREHSDLWSRSRFDIGELRLNGQLYEVRIPTGDAHPIRWNQDRVPYH